MLTKTSLDTLYRDALNFPMAPKGMKASKCIKKPSKAEMVYWKTIYITLEESEIFLKKRPLQKEIRYQAKSIEE